MAECPSTEPCARQNHVTARVAMLGSAERKTARQMNNRQGIGEIDGQRDTLVYEVDGDCATSDEQ